MNKLICLFLLVLASCQPIQGPSKNAGSLRRVTLCTNTDITSLDPRVSFLTPTLHVLRMVFEGLTRLGPDGKPTLALADRYEVSTDGTVYTFHLRESRWTNGDLVTAEDFLYSWRGTLAPSNPSRAKVAFYPFKNVEAYTQGLCTIEEVGFHVLDDYTLQIELEHPYESLFQLLAYPTLAPLPRNIDKENSNWMKQTGEQFVCNGPFMLKNREESNEIQLAKNPHYWDASHIQLDEILIYVIPDIATQDAMFQKGEIDFLGQPLVDLTSEIISRLDTAGELHQIPSTEIFWCAINTRHPLLGHPKMREALATAIDRHTIVQHILPKGFRAATGILPLQMTQMNQPKFSDGNPKKAQKLFGEALHEMGLSKAELPTLTLLYSPKELVEKVVHIVCDQWKKTLGLDVKLECVELKMRQARMKGGAFELGTYIWFSWVADPLYTLHNYRMKDTLYNYTGWSDPAFSRLLKQFQMAQNKQERSAFLRQAEEAIMEEFPLVPIFFGALNFAKNPLLQNVVVSPYFEFDLRWAYFIEIP